MKKLTTVLHLMLLILMGGIFINFSSVPPRGKTLAPGEGYCAECHTPSSNYNGNISIVGIPSSPVAGTTYSVEVVLTATTGTPVRGGFELVVIDGSSFSSPSVGTFSNAEANVQFISQGSRTYALHSGAKFFSGNSVSYTFDWTAPSTSVNDLNIYASAVLGSGSAGSSFDTPIFTSIQNLVLPIEISEFWATREGSAVVLTWATASEINADAFEVQRSIDGKNFEKIGKVNAMGNTLEGGIYDFEDNSPTAAKSYYRLKLVDLDGSVDYTEVIVVEELVASNAVKVYPTLVSGNSDVFIAGAERYSQYTIVNSNGLSVAQGNLADLATSRISISSLENGMYILLLSGKAMDTHSERFIIL